MSVMYKRNNRGPSIEPCGTPQVIPLATDIVLSTSVICTLPVKYDQNQHIYREFINTYTTKFLQKNGMIHSIKSFLQIQ